MSKGKIYRPKSGFRFMSYQELETREELRDKVLDTLKNWMGTHTIPEIAERHLGTNLRDIAYAPPATPAGEALIRSLGLSLEELKYCPGL